MMNLLLSLKSENRGTSLKRISQMDMIFDQMAARGLALGSDLGYVETIELTISSLL